MTDADPSPLEKSWNQIDQPINRSEYFILGRLHLFRREYDESISGLRTAINLNPCLATAYCGLGDSLSFSGRLAEAIPNFEQAVRLSPHDPRKWLFLVYGSLTLMQLERFDEAADWAARAMALSNATFWAQVQLTAVHEAAGDTNKARSLGRDLLHRQPEFSSRGFAEQFLFYHYQKSSIYWYASILMAAGLPA